MQKHYLSDLIEPVVEELGYEVVRILTMGDTNQTLQIMVEHQDYEKELTVDDCAKVSRAVSAVLDEKDPIADRYTLEVSSPGLDRPLTKLKHFERYVGYVAKVETSELVENRKRFKGIIDSVREDGKIELTMEEEKYEIPFSSIIKAKLVLTDELWEQYLKSHKKADK